ncbi:hypothetical protein FRC17_002576 [Serendipita sp. 399]|nr:hypothetical protein FRC17_002576 [Serendipita sp. 399]
MSMSRKRKTTGSKKDAQIEPEEIIPEDEQLRIIQESGIMKIATENQEATSPSEDRQDDAATPTFLDEILDTVILLIPFSFLYIGMDIMIKRQYAQHPNFKEEVGQYLSAIPRDASEVEQAADQGSTDSDTANETFTLDEDSMRAPPSIILDTPDDEADQSFTSVLQQSEPPSLYTSPKSGKKWARWTKRATKAMTPYQNLKLTLQTVARGSFSSSSDRKGSLAPSDDSPMAGSPVSPTFLRHRHLIERVQNQGLKRTQRFKSTSNSSSTSSSSWWNSDTMRNENENTQKLKEVPVFYGWTAYCGRFNPPCLVSPTHWDDLVQHRRETRLKEIEQEVAEDADLVQLDETVSISSEVYEGMMDDCYSSWTIVTDDTMLSST